MQTAQKQEQFDLMQLDAQAGFAVFKEVPYEDYTDCCTAVLDMTGCIKFVGGIASISASDGVLIFLNEQGTEVHSCTLLNAHESPECMQYLKSIFNEDIFILCLKQALQGLVL